MAAGMVEDEKKITDPKFPFRVTDGQWDVVLELRDSLKKNDSFKCQAISLKSLVSWPPKGVPIHSCRTLASNFDLLSLVVPYMNKTLAIKRVHCLQWILETVVAIRWQAWLGRSGVMEVCDVRHTCIYFVSQEVMVLLEQVRHCRSMTIRKRMSKGMHSHCAR